MKSKRVLALILSASLPVPSFAQSFSVGASAAAESGVSGAAGTVRTVPQLGGALNLSLSAPSIGPSLTPTPGVTLGVIAAPAALGPSALIPVNAAAAAPEALKPAAPAGAKGEAIKPAKSASAAAALKPILSAASKGDAPGKAEAAPESGASELFDGAKNLKAFVVRHGKPMVEVSLAEAAAHRGPVRLLAAKNDPTGLNAKDRKRVSAAIGRKIQGEEISVDWSPKTAAGEQAASAASAGATKGLAGILLWPVREAKFLAKAFKASLVKPEASEIVGGFATKTFPLVTSIGVYWATVGPAFPFVLGGLIALSVAQEVFHGFFLKSWNNFQKAILRGRGFNYQMFFNLAYMQGMGSLYRLLSWSANPSSVTPPWSPKYWADIIVMSLFGTFFGVLGYNSLNELYDKGVIKRWQHSGIQQVRDLCFLLAAPFFASGSMAVFWSIFVFQQLLDLAIGVWAGRMAERPILFVTSDAVAASAEFKKQYPAEGLTVVPPIKQAVKATVENPVTRLLTWPFRAIWKAVRRNK